MGAPNSFVFRIQLVTLPEIWCYISLRFESQGVRNVDREVGAVVVRNRHRAHLGEARRAAVTRACGPSCKSRSILWRSAVSGNRWRLRAFLEFTLLFADLNTSKVDMLCEL